MGKNKMVLIAVALLAGYMFSDQIAKLPLVSKLPKF
jgi:hypothetical protein